LATKRVLRSATARDALRVDADLELVEPPERRRSMTQTSFDWVRHVYAHQIAADGWAETAGDRLTIEVLGVRDRWHVGHGDDRWCGRYGRWCVLRPARGDDQCTGENKESVELRIHDGPEMASEDAVD
jgi:hypothetical protein